jgi:hypothetical protein
VKARILWLAGVVLFISGCQEKLTAPADCPALCPSDQPELFDETFNPIAGADSSFVGYIRPQAALALLVSNGLLGFEERALVRFGSRADSVSVRDTLRAYTIDSVALSVTIVARDTNLTGLQVLLYRLPASIDTTSTFASVAPAFAPESLIATLPVADTLNTGVIRALFQGPDLSRVMIAPSDSGRMAIGVRIESPTPTGIRIGAVAGGIGPTFTTYATLDVPDTGAARLRNIVLGPVFNTHVSEVQQTLDTTLLAVGGEPSARALLRFSLPSRILDSATIVRATLELTPTAPISGLPTDPARLHARAVLSDVGAKSPVNSSAGRVPEDTLELGATTVSLEAVRLVELWLGRTTRPSALVLSMAPELEAASFTRPVFYSTRAPDPAVRPRLRLTYLLSPRFENP